MLYYVSGPVAVLEPGLAVIDCGGVGYACRTTSHTLAAIRQGEKAKLFTHLNVREDALDLFGFSTEYELEWFKMLITVNGVGPKAALAILSELTVDEIALAISTKDAKSITRASGIGPKIAQRIILDLKDKVKSVIPDGEIFENADRIGAVTEMPNTSEAIAALTMLGYSQSDASVAVSKLEPTLDVQSLIKQALKILSKM